MRSKIIHNNLTRLFSDAAEFYINNESRLVIFSDLHIGNGSSRDDFVSNAYSFMYVLKNYYLKKEYTLVLNGDIEELYRFSLKSIIKKWKKLYKLFNEFHDNNRLIKIVGNHDYKLYSKREPDVNRQLHHAIKLNYRDNMIFIFHGHQASFFPEKTYNCSEFFLRAFANPLGIKNVSVAHNSKKKYRIENRVYDFSNHKKIVSVIGHTHRPLFESLSKIDSLKFKIEQLCREYPEAGKNSRIKIEESIRKYKSELHYYYTEDRTRGIISSLYNTSVVIPSLFNSGCVIGKRGMTAIEINRGEISLVHWFDRNISRKYFYYNDFKPEQLINSDYYRMVLKKDFLKYIFSRVKLLS